MTSTTDRAVSAAEKVARIASVAAEIAADMEADVRAFEGKPFDGRTVGEMHGNLAAGIAALAGMVTALAAYVDEAIHDHTENAPHIYADGSSA